MNGGSPPHAPGLNGERDERTTPGWLRLPSLGLLAVVVVYFLTAYTFALGAPMPAWARPYPWVWWFASWEMFTLLDPNVSLVKAEAQYGEEWVKLDLEGLFPTQWESGPRYARSSFYRHPPSMHILADSTCGRADGDPDRVRFERVSFKKKLGRSSRKPPKGANREVLLDWKCGKPVRRPEGTRW